MILIVYDFNAHIRSISLHLLIKTCALVKHDICYSIKL